MGIFDLSEVITFYENQVGQETQRLGLSNYVKCLEDAVPTTDGKFKAKTDYFYIGDFEKAAEQKGKDGKGYYACLMNILYAQQLLLQQKGFNLGACAERKTCRFIQADRDWAAGVEVGAEKLKKGRFKNAKKNKKNVLTPFENIVMDPMIKLIL